jgi:hypothetical protein
MLSLLVIFVINFSLAKSPLSPFVKDIDKVFDKNREILETCTDKYLSPDKSTGCVDSFKYMYGICEVTHEHDFYNRYRRIPYAYFYRACKLSGKASTHIQHFFEQDEKSCAKGFETIRDRLESLEKSRDVLEELLNGKYAYNLEKSLCKDFRKYINFCEYVDGDLKNLEPTNFAFLPSVGNTTVLTNSCHPANPQSSTILDISKEIKEAANQPTLSVYKNLVSKYKNRIPASTAGVSNDCENLRTSYRSFNCAKFEAFSDQEPIWLNEVDYNNLIKKQNDDIKRQNQGGQGAPTSN